MRFSRNMAAVTAVSLVLLIGVLSGLAGLIPGGWQSAEASVLEEAKKLLASDGATGDRFGLSVAVDGDTGVVGARGEDTKGSGAGAAYVFDRDDGGADNWGEVKQLFASNAGADDVFGRSVAVDGDTAVVGAPHEDTKGSNAGAAYVFQRDEGGTDNWGQVTMLTASDAAADDQFGLSVAVDGDTVVVAANAENDGAGAAYVFERDEGGTDNWGQVKKLTASDAEESDQFGWSAALDGDTVVVGAVHEDTGGDDAGAAYVFGRNEGGSGNWGEEKKIVASDAEEYDLFGWSVAVTATASRAPSARPRLAVTTATTPTPASTLALPRPWATASTRTATPSTIATTTPTVTPSASQRSSAAATSAARTPENPR